MATLLGVQRLRPPVPSADLLLVNAEELATPVGSGPQAGPDAGRLQVVADAAVAVRDGRLVAVGTTSELSSWSADRVVDCAGCTIVPGLVDAHTHLVWAGHRAHELTLKLEGASYEEILAQGGGIHSTVESTRKASRDEIEAQAQGRLNRCLAQGTTTLEAKTGYALTVEGELELLRALESLGDHRVDVVPTLLGAHAVPADQDRDAYVDAVVDELTPAAAREGLATFCDAFVDEGAFTVDEGRRVLEAGRDAGMAVRIHADELARTGAFELGLELDASSLDHLNRLTGEDVARLGEAASADWSGVATLCPATPFTSSIPYPPARDLVEAGVPVALGSDMNPNAWSEGMLLAMTLAVHALRLTPAEALVAATANSAHSLGFDDRGRLQEGLVADLVVLDAPGHEHIGYRIGGPPVRTVVKDGKVVA